MPTTEGRHFVVHYQPKIDLASGRLIGHEALLRERHDTVLVSPGAIFAGLDEANLRALLLETTRHVLTDACRVLEAGASPSVAVNVPPALLEDPEFLGILTSNVAKAGSMTIEILEYPGPSIPTLSAACQKLRLAGFEIALDDFGEGESNLMRAIALMPREIKLDAKLLAYPEGRRLLPPLCAVIRETGALVCIEGVETQEDHDLAVASGASSAQGFFYGMPSPL